jgi:hypothetical protein
MLHHQEQASENKPGALILAVGAEAPVPAPKCLKQRVMVFMLIL